MLAPLAALLVATTPLCERVLLRAELSQDLRRVSGTLTCEGGKPAAVAVYPRLLRAERGLDDVSRPWFYPGGWSPAAVALRQGAALLEGEGAWQRLADPGAPLAFETTLPERNGAFGRRAGAAYLLGGWHPAFGRPGEPLPDVPITFAIDVPPDTAGFAGVTPFGRSGPRRIHGRFRGRFLPLVVAPGLRVRRTPDAVIVRQEPERGSLRDLGAERDDEAVDELAATLAEGAALAARRGLGRRPIVVVVGPLRHRLVEPFDGGLLVSDRAFHVPALELFRRFHRLAIWRGQLAVLARPAARAREREWPADVAADAVAVALRNALARERYGDAAFMPELLAPFAVIPEIESLVYAPQIAFVDAYFDAVDERRAGPPELRDFEAARPHGKLLYEKLVDWVGADRALAVTTAYLGDTRSYLGSVTAHAGSDPAQALATWMGPPPAVDYALAAVRTGDGFTEVSVEARGQENDRPPERLRVTVEAGGQRHEETRTGPGVVRFATPGPLTSVELDPAGRLVEAAHAPGAGPRLNNRVPARWSFLLNDVTGLVAVTNRQLSASADFSLRRLHDLRYRLDLQGVYSPEAYRLGLGVSYGFGREVTPLRLAARAGLTLQAGRLRVERGVGDAGYELGASLYFLHDTRPSPYVAYEGQGFSARVAGASGIGRDGGRYRYGRLSASALRLLRLGSYHAILGRVRADLVTGDAPGQQLLRLGGRYSAGRGYEADEARGRRRLVASVEDRHALSAGTRTDLAGLFVVTGVEGALFADAVYLPVRGPGCRRDVFVDVGCGLRLLVDLLGVSPSSLALDLGVPLGRCAGERHRPPVTVYLAFVQSFLAF